MTLADRQWRYSAEDAGGGVISGIVDAPDPDTAAGILRSQRLTPLHVKPVGASMFITTGAHGPRNRLTLAELSDTTSRLRDLLGGGIPIAPALKLLAQQLKGARERDFAKGLLHSIGAGRSLTEAVATSAFETPRLFHALIETGEALGSLDKQFDRLAAHYSSALKLRREATAQLAYPAALVVLVIATIAFLSFFVLPKFESIFETSATTPPPETRFVLAVGSLIRRYWMLFPLLAVIGVFGVRYFIRTQRAAFSRAMLQTPILGGFLRYSDYGAFFRTLSTLLEGGAPISRAIPLAAQAISNRSLQEEAKAAENEVRVGVRLAAALSGRTTCPKELVSFVEIGEETGALATMTAQAASRAETVVASTLRRCTTFLAPALTLLMGILTAGVIASVMTGVLSLNETIN